AARAMTSPPTPTRQDALGRFRALGQNRRTAITTRGSSQSQRRWFRAIRVVRRRSVPKLVKTWWNCGMTSVGISAAKRAHISPAMSWITAVEPLPWVVDSSTADAGGWYGLVMLLWVRLQP